MPCGRAANQRRPEWHFQWPFQHGALAIMPPAPTLLYFLPSSVFFLFVFLWPAVLELIHNPVISLSHFFVICLPPWHVGQWEVLIKDQLQASAK